MRRIASLIIVVGLFGWMTVGANAAGGATTASLTGGSLSITGAAPGEFSATLGGVDQSVYSSLAAYTAADATGTGAGWHVTFQADQFTDSDSGKTLAAGSLYMMPPTVDCHAGVGSCSGTSAVPTIGINDETAIDNGAVTVASAGTDAGMGTYDFTPAVESGSDQLRLFIPAGAYAGTYQSTLTVSIVSAP